MKICSSLFAIGALLSSQVAFGQGEETNYVPEVADGPRLENGWKYNLGVTVGGQFRYADNTIGEPEGHTNTYTLGLKSGIDFRDGPFEWTNSLVINEGISKTPAIDEYIKSADELRLESVGYYFFPSIDWLGSFGRLAVNTTLFKGYDVKGEETTWVITNPEGETRTVTAEKLRLTAPGRPLVTKESLGLVARPINESYAKGEVRFGIGAKQTIVDGQLTIDDNEETEEVIEVRELEDFSEAGLEAVVKVSGDISDTNISYEVYAEALAPYFQLPDLPEGDEREADQLVSSELGVKVALNIVEWSALVYDYKTIKEPLISPQARATHNVLLTVAYKTGN